MVTSLPRSVLSVGCVFHPGKLITEIGGVSGEKFFKLWIAGEKKRKIIIVSF